MYRLICQKPTSPFFVCPNGFNEHLFSNVYSTWMYNFGVGARLQVQKTEDLDKEREAGLPKTTLDTELKVNAKFYDIYTP